MGSYNDIADVKEHVGVIGGISAWNDVVLASIEYRLLLPTGSRSIESWYDDRQV